MRPKKISAPVASADIKALKAGDEVLRCRPQTFIRVNKKWKAAAHRP